MSEEDLGWSPIVSDMPLRPRQHQLERESREAFRRALPAAWVPREVQPDYGIDEQIEIFTEGGVATGRSFLVQLKGTDEVDVGKALRVRLKRRTISYMAEQDSPVLIVRYLAGSKALFAKWLHTFDPHYGSEDQETISLGLADVDKWTDETPTKLVQDVERFRYERTQPMSFPLVVYIDIESESVLGIERSALRLSIRNLLSEVPEIARLGDLSETSRELESVTISITEDQTVVNPGGTSTMTVHHNPDVDEDERGRIPGDVCLALVVWLGQRSQWDAAARLARVVAHKSNLLNDNHVLPRVIGSFVRAHRIAEALELAEELAKSEEYEWLGQVLSSFTLFGTDSLTESEANAVKAFFQKKCNDLDESEDAANGRVAHYNFGRFLRGIDDEAALSHYRRATELDPDYLERPYFLHEMGGILFHLNQFDEAVAAYEAALEREDDSFRRALLADCQMFAGNYGLALGSFETHIEENANPPAEFQLKCIALRHVLVPTFGLTQRRDPERSASLAGLPPEAAEKEAIERMQEALQLDALNGTAWFNLGVSLSRGDDREGASNAFLLASLSHPGDVEAWSNSFGLALSLEGGVELAALILEAGYRLNGSKFVERLVHSAKSQPPGFPVNEYLSAIEELLKAIPEERMAGPVLRVLGEGPDFHEIDLGSDEEP